MPFFLMNFAKKKKTQTLVDADGNLQIFCNKLEYWTMLLGNLTQNQECQSHCGAKEKLRGLPKILIPLGSESVHLDQFLMI